jgi:hypothetical protein
MKGLELLVGTGLQRTDWDRQLSVICMQCEFIRLLSISNGDLCRIHPYDCGLHLITAAGTDLSAECESVNRTVQCGDE